MLLWLLSQRRAGVLLSGRQMLLWLLRKKHWRFAERPADAAVVVEQKGRRFAERPADAAVVVEQKGRRLAERPVDAAVVVEEKALAFC
jgi:hypothetical protein